MNENELRDFRKKMRQLERSVGGVFGEKSLCCGITAAQCHTLLAVEEKGEASVTSLAADLGLDKSTLSRTVDGLVRAGLVSRRMQTGNRRAQCITLTPKGQKTADAIHCQWNRFYRDLFARIPKSRHRQILESISSITEAIAAGSRACMTGGRDRPR